MTGADLPRQLARTRRFTLGRPRSVTVAPDGDRVLFLRSPAGDDPVTALWALDRGGDERRLADPRELGGHGPASAAERARRERLREAAEGITAYATDRAVSRAVFTHGGRLHVVDADGAHTRPPAGGDGAPFDPRLSPGGGRVAHVADGAVWTTPADGSGRPRRVVGGDGQAVTWGMAEFAAAEEMGRTRGFWWSPDGTTLAACRVDTSPVERWHLSDPASPGTAPTEQRYPAAGTANADVSLAVVDPDGQRPPRPVRWDRRALPYLVRVSWPQDGPLTLLVQSRDQRRWQVRTAAPGPGDGPVATELAHEQHTAPWLTIVDGAPAWLDDGRLVTVGDTDRGQGGTRSLLVDGAPATPPGLQVARVVAVDDGRVWLTGATDPTEQHVHRLDVATGELARLTDPAGWHGAAAAGGTVVVASALAGAGAPSGTAAGSAERTVVRWAAGGERELASHREQPVVTASPSLLELGERRLRGALLTPSAEADTGGPLPVLLAPYGGPGAQRAVAARDAHVTGQWLADRGMAVLVVDGRGTPGRGPDWEHAVAGDLAGPVLDDQVAALHAAAEHEPRLDLDRVAIRGWSFGGYLAALAVLRRPEVFRAGIAGAPVTDWRLYDTHYTERYLGRPDDAPGAYRRSSLVDADGGLVGAVEPSDGADRDLLIIHGLADDNVVAAHSLRLSAALLAAGRPHRFLPLSGVTHMTAGQEQTEANLLRLQARFLAGALGIGAGQAPGP